MMTIDRKVKTNTYHGIAETKPHNAAARIAQNHEELSLLSKAHDAIVTKNKSVDPFNSVISLKNVVCNIISKMTIGNEMRILIIFLESSIMELKVQFPLPGNL